MKKQPEISICIVSFNACEYLRDCLDSILGSPRQVSIEIIIADNHSNDGTVEMLREQYPDLYVIHNSHNEGFSKPANMAIKASRGRAILLLNPDTVILNSSIEALIRYLDSNPQVGIVGPRILNRDGSLQRQCRRSEGRPWDAFCHLSGLSLMFPRNPRFSGYLMTYLDDDLISEVQSVSGACMLVRREVFDQVGLLDERFFAYQEDSDLCYRARHADWKVCYLPSVEIIHYGGRGGAGVHPYRSLLEWHRSYYRYYRKHFAAGSPLLLNLAIYLMIAGKFALTFVVALFRKHKYVGSKKP